MGLVFSNQRKELVSQMEVVLQFLKNRLLNHPECIVASEMTGQVDFLMPDAVLNQVRAVLMQITGGHIPASASKIADGARQKKTKAFDYYKGLQSQLRQIASNKKRGALARTTFEEFYQQYWAKHGHSFINQFCNVYEVCDPGGVAVRVLSEPDRYPYSTLFLKIIARALYQYLVTDRRVDKGDMYDFRQLTYMEGLDLLVTDDGKLREIFTQVSTPTKRVLTPIEFMTASWCD